jgi:uncharacterized protein (TIGR02271 family)
MSTVEKSIDVNVPVRTAYNQWTQFEDFPHFMEGVREVKQLDDKRLHWCTTIGGKDKEWDAEITEQLPDQRIAWRSLAGTHNAGVVTFHRLADHQTRVMVQMDYEPEGFLENVGDWLGATSHRVEGDLERFKEFVEHRRHETGAWRGEIHQPAAHPAITAERGQQQVPPRTAAPAEGEVRIPVVEEELKVGKRVVEQQGVRVQSHVTEQPVEQEVPLREERVTVARRPVDRPLSGTEAEAFKEGTIEVRESREEPVVSKQARVVEEVVISKEAHEHTERVQGTVRRTEVEVEQPPVQSVAAAQGLAEDEAAFRHHFTTTLATKGYPYDEYVPAYRYGAELAAEPRYQHKEWSAIEPEVRHSWEERHPGSWERYRDALRYAWERVRGRRPMRAA